MQDTGNIKIQRLLTKFKKTRPHHSIMSMFLNNKTLSSETTEKPRLWRKQTRILLRKQTRANLSNDVFLLLDVQRPL
jgi:hypothetical protein